LTPQLSRSEVQTKYGPPGDPRWTPEVEKDFLALLDRRRPHDYCPTKVRLLREYAVDTLGAKRLSIGYLAGLGSVLAKIAVADCYSIEWVFSQRDDRLGPRRTLRTIQTQMEAVGLLVRVARTQGHGFIGDVLVYRSCTVPCGEWQFASMEEAYRSKEGEAAYPFCPENITADDVPFDWLNDPLIQVNQIEEAYG
jgi:hypothetical protein